MVHMVHFTSHGAAVQGHLTAASLVLLLLLVEMQFKLLQ